MERNNNRLLQSSLFLSRSTRANGDVSVLLYDKSPMLPSSSDLRKVVGYLVDYASKSNETGKETSQKMKNIIMEEEEGDSLTPDVRRVAVKCMNQITKDKLISKQEAMCLMGNLDLFICSESIEQISTSGNARIDPDGSIVRKSFISDYAGRKDEHELEKSFYQWIYDKKNSKRHPSAKKVIPHFFGVNLNSQTSITKNYALNILKIYKPWKDAFPYDEEEKKHCKRTSNS